jgi:hypothetical protein
MPKNRFPDSQAKRELRRQDARRLTAFQMERNFSTGLNYCGMPSVEFLDVRAWQKILRSVCAVEYDDDVIQDMRIEWDTLALDLPLRIVRGNILDFLVETNEVYDVYNLDFYSGFVYKTAKGARRCPEAIRTLIGRQALKAHSFALITTLNVRDKGAAEYLDFIRDVPKALKGWENIEACCHAHQKNNITRLKLCFPYFCWHMGTSNNFAVRFANPVVYKSSVTLLHFYAEFLYEPRSLPNLGATEILVDVANRPLMRLDGMIERVEMRPPEITRP